MTDDIKKKAEEWVDKYVGPYTDRFAVTHELVQAYLAGAKERDKFWGAAIRILRDGNVTQTNLILDQMTEAYQEALEES